MKKPHLTLIFILGLALFLRVYRAHILTGFYFDQGRDAKIIWDLIHNHRFFLIGPTTGIEGIFLGPAYYYLITPFYFLGSGNPVAPAVGLALMCVAGIYMTYLIALKYFNANTALLAALLMATSLELVQAHRWLSNPTPLYLSSAIAVWLLLKIVYGSKPGWIWLSLGLSLGLSLQFEAASAVFFLPATLAIFVLFRKTIVWKFANLIHLFFAFLTTLLPQLIFNIRHDNILVRAFRQFLITEKSFAPSGADFYPNRLKFYFDSFVHKLTLDTQPAIYIFLLLVILAAVVWKHLPQKPARLLLIWLAAPLVFLLFYRGNYGYIWSYYFTGVYLVFMLIVAVVLTYTFTHSFVPFKKGLVGMVIAYLLVWNSYHLYHYLRANPDGDTAIMLGSSLAAVDWVLQDAGARQFNVDVYVPPVISHAYDYLFLWRGTTSGYGLPSPGLTPLLYTIYEVDPPHPERLEAWLARQATYATPEATVQFGGVWAQRRLRFP